MTPLFIALIAIGGTDVLFALDSSPALPGVTSEAHQVFAANTFAPLGLRALYFLVTGLPDRMAPVMARHDAWRDVTEGAARVGVMAAALLTPLGWGRPAIWSAARRPPRAVTRAANWFQPRWGWTHGPAACAAGTGSGVTCPATGAASTVVLPLPASPAGPSSGRPPGHNRVPTASTRSPARTGSCSTSATSHWAGSPGIWDITSWQPY